MTMARLLLTIPYYNFFPPRNGGQLRCFYLLRELAREHQVHAIILQPEGELRRPQNGYQFPESVQIHGPAQTPPPETVFNRLPHKLGTALHYRWLRRSWRGPASSILLETHHLIDSILKRYEIDVAFLTTTTSMNALAPMIKRASPRTIRVVNTENIEHHLLAHQIESCQVKKEKDYLCRRYREALRLETDFSRYVDAFFTCSDQDCEILQRLNPRVEGFTVPNGVDTQAMSFDECPDKCTSNTIIFCGSLDYPPNREGLEWFHMNIWPLILNGCPGARLLVVGRGAHSEDYVNLRADPAVEFVGAVDDVVPSYRRAGIAVVPLHSGSGTRLKILEAMSLGNPVVSTTIGAQGLAVEKGKHILLANDPAQFADAVCRLLTTPPLFEAIRRHARQQVGQIYDWRAIGARMNAVIANLTCHPSGNNVSTY